MTDRDRLETQYQALQHLRASLQEWLDADQYRPKAMQAPPELRRSWDHRINLCLDMEGDLEERLTDLRLDAMFIPKEESDAAWLAFCEQHIQPSRLFRIARGMIETSPADAVHISECVSCRTAHAAYSKDFDKAGPVEAKVTKPRKRKSVAEVDGT